MGCRFAGGADTPAAYLDRLMTGEDALSDSDIKPRGRNSGIIQLLSCRV